MAVYPKIKGVPPDRVKEHYRRELSKIIQANQMQDKTRKADNLRSLINEREEFNEHATIQAKLDA